ncbi:MAG: YXWGXW repeat-containing protein [Gammaproteobacteria bacterium]
MRSRHIELRPVIRTLLFLGAGLVLSATISLHRVYAASEIVTDTPPPPLQIEHAPPQRDGYVWGAGHWEWNGRSYVWVAGTWILERRTAHWVSAAWEKVGSQWHYIAGHWQR